MIDRQALLSAQAAMLDWMCAELGEEAVGALLAACVIAAQPRDPDGDAQCPAHVHIDYAFELFEEIAKRVRRS